MLARRYNETTDGRIFYAPQAFIRKGGFVLMQKNQRKLDEIIVELKELADKLSNQPDNDDIQEIIGKLELLELIDNVDEYGND